MKCDVMSKNAFPFRLLWSYLHIKLITFQQKSFYGDNNNTIPFSK